jgi:hypothetical protein
VSELDCRRHSPWERTEEEVEARVVAFDPPAATEPRSRRASYTLSQVAVIGLTQYSGAYNLRAWVRARGA